MADLIAVVFPSEEKAEEVRQKILGSDEYVRQFVDLALRRSKMNGEFLLIQPGGELQQEMFLR